MPSRRRPRPRRPRRNARPPGRSFLRRRSTLWLIAAVVTLTVGIVLGAIAGTGDGDDDGPVVPTPTLAVPLPDLQPNPTSLQRAEVVEVIDGDTIDVRIPSLRSGQAGREERVRYYGVDTPERGERCFDEATERNEALAGDTVLLLPDARERDRGGRLLRYVFDVEGRSIDARLIAEGLGAAWRPDGAYRDELVALEEEVRTAQVGCLWKP